MKTPEISILQYSSITFSLLYTDLLKQYCYSLQLSWPVTVCEENYTCILR